MNQGHTNNNELNCLGCGYDLRGSPSLVCSECGEVNTEQVIAESRDYCKRTWRTLSMIIFTPPAILVAFALMSVVAAVLREDELAVGLVGLGLILCIPIGVGACVAGAARLTQVQLMGSRLPYTFDKQPTQSALLFVVHFAWITIAQFAMIVFTSFFVLFIYDLGIL